MLLVKALNATLVEPNIQNGCVVPPGEGNLGLLELYDPKTLLKYHLKWATAQEYQQAVQQSHPQVFEWCIANQWFPSCKKEVWDYA